MQVTVSMTIIFLLLYRSQVKSRTPARTAAKPFARRVRFRTIWRFTPGKSRSSARCAANSSGSRAHWTATFASTPTTSIVSTGFSILIYLSNSGERSFSSNSIIIIFKCYNLYLTLTLWTVLEVEQKRNKLHFSTGKPSQTEPRSMVALNGGLNLKDEDVKPFFAMM